MSATTPTPTDEPPAPEAPGPEAIAERFAPRWRDRLAVAGFILVLLIPMGMRATLQRGLPGNWVLAKLHNIACLFPRKPQGWSSYYIQARFADGVRWETLDQAELFPMQPFGRRTRYHRLMVDWGAKAGPRTEELARWVVLEWMARHPDEAPPEKVRFSRTWIIPEPGDPPPEKGWSHPRWEEVPARRRRVIATYAVAELFAEEAQP
ncbi:hypothetical protein PPSIR1_42246 [Plesiocystis pacifica SIR-1]|uniref:Uncharacterized protein n=1 Tax=Plesiocystis pacifica SIR-1 TaxID=391625 RepID=A6GD05_9BACT|nr:hypothetical protein [Plesiocystis pacifica]EDM76243.1 hypothetical protein PPSIR1_42246 [Plesiocystis pacifica SIR-1]